MGVDGGGLGEDDRWNPDNENVSITPYDKQNSK